MYKKYYMLSNKCCEFWYTIQYVHYLIYNVNPKSQIKNKLGHQNVTVNNY